MPVRPRPKSPTAVSVPPSVAAALSFLFPGLGQVATGRTRRGAIVAIPALAVVASFVLVLLFARHQLFGEALNTQWLTSLLIVDLLAMAYHLWAIIDAYLLARGGKPLPIGTARYLSIGAVVVLVVGTLGIHAGIASVDIQAQQTLNCVFNPNGPCGITDLASGQTLAADTAPPDDEDLATDTPNPSASAQGPSASTGPTATPAPYPTVPPYTGDPTDWQADGYLNLLLLGGDAGIGRGGNGAGKPVNLRTDSIILLQVNLNTGQSAMYGIPRNLFNVPLGANDENAYACHCFPKYFPWDTKQKYGPNYFFGLWVDAVNYPKLYQYPGINYFARGTKAVEGAVGALMGVHVDGAVVVDLMGFVNLIDQLAPNGLNVDVPYKVTESPGVGYPKPDGSGDIYNIVFNPGSQTMNGLQALEFARMRHVVGHDSDYERMARQQLVLKAVRDQLNPCDLATRVPSLLSAIQGTIWTDMPVDDAPALAALASKISTSSVKGYGLTPSNGYAEDVSGAGVLQKYRDAAAHGLDGVPSAFSGGSGGGSSGFHC